MPRNYGGRSSSRSPSTGSRSSYSSTARPQQQSQPTYQQSSVPVQKPSMLGGIGQTVVQGMAFGAGSEVAHQAVRSMMGGGSHSQQVQPQNQVENSNQLQNTQQKNPCMDFNTKFVDCLKENGNDISSCQNFFNDLKSCEKNYY